MATLTNERFSIGIIGSEPAGLWYALRQAEWLKKEGLVYVPYPTPQHPLKIPTVFQQQFQIPVQDEWALDIATPQTVFPWSKTEMASHTLIGKNKRSEEDFERLFSVASAIAYYFNDVRPTTFEEVVPLASQCSGFVSWRPWNQFSSNVTTIEDNPEKIQAIHANDDFLTLEFSKGKKLSARFWLLNLKPNDAQDFFSKPLWDAYFSHVKMNRPKGIEVCFDTGSSNILPGVKPLTFILKSHQLPDPTSEVVVIEKERSRLTCLLPHAVGEENAEAYARGVVEAEFPTVKKEIKGLLRVRTKYWMNPISIKQQFFHKRLYWLSPTLRPFLPYPIGPMQAIRRLVELRKQRSFMTAAWLNPLFYKVGEEKLKEEKKLSKGEKANGS